ncbi:RanGTP-binding protein-domain-containing protein [Spinellus fusiger]|nr:RanGTP-binding protein-domain-containing protein [Spinellus fusiger]
MTSLEDLFGKLAMTTVTTVSRIALSHATNAAIRNVTSYIVQQPKSKEAPGELESLQHQLDLKIRSIKPTLDRIAHSVADGNIDLEPALEMCNDLKKHIEVFAASTHNEKMSPEAMAMRLRQLIHNVDDCVPFLHLALRSLKTEKQSIASARLLAASHLLKQATLQQKNPKDPKDPKDPKIQKIHKLPFCLRLYSLFAANARSAEKSPFTWKEEFHKCTLSILSLEKDPHHYQLMLTEDLDDGLYHEELEDQEKSSTGKSLVIDIARVKRMYYTQSGALLNIEDAVSAVLVLKVQTNIDPSGPQAQTLQETPHIGHEELQQADWYAVEMWTEQEEEEEQQQQQKEEEEEEEEEEQQQQQQQQQPQPQQKSPTSLLLLESVIRLALLEVTEHMDHLEASDELIDLYMAQ